MIKNKVYSILYPLSLVGSIHSKDMANTCGAD